VCCKKLLAQGGVCGWVGGGDRGRWRRGACVCEEGGLCREESFLLSWHKGACVIVCLGGVLCSEGTAGNTKGTTMPRRPAVLPGLR
jgi:hypothetical protein